MWEEKVRNRKKRDKEDKRRRRLGDTKEVGT